MFFLRPKKDPMEFYKISELPAIGPVVSQNDIIFELEIDRSYYFLSPFLFNIITVNAIIAPIAKKMNKTTDNIIRGQ